MNILLDLILVLFFAKLFGAFTERIRLVELLGAILAGVLLGPILGLVDAQSIEPFGRIGLILILFLAGFEEFKIEEILKEKIGILSTGLIGGILPFIMGLIMGLLFNFSLIESLFMGGIMAATSVSISVGTLISTRKINSRVGRFVVTSSILDDLVGLFILIFIIGFATTGHVEFMDVLFLLGKIILFGFVIVVLIYMLPKLFGLVLKTKTEEIDISAALVIILLLGFLSESLGFSSIIGAFFAGVMLSKVPALKTRIEIEKFKAIALGFFVTIFFAWVGLQITIHINMIGIFTLVFILVAILGKIIAALISGTIAKMNFLEKLSLGIARIPRGEVALSILLIGKKIGVVPDIVFGATFVLILVTIVITPIILKPLLMKNSEVS